MSWSSMRNYLVLATLVISLGAVGACGGETKDEPTNPSNNTTNETNDNNNDTNDDDQNDDDNTDPAAVKQQLCTDMCEKQLQCLQEMSCQGLAGTTECVSQCVTQPVTQADRDQLLATACEAINVSVCTEYPDYQQACQCPSLGACSEGQTCLPLTNGGGVCGMAGGSAPSDAAVCDAQTACPQETDICVAFQQGATSGYCLAPCGN